MYEKIGQFFRDYDSYFQYDAKRITFYFSNKNFPELANEWGLSKVKFLPVGASDKRIRPKIKCNFCGLKFYGIDDRNEHEIVWHPGKVANKE